MDTFDTFAAAALTGILARSTNESVQQIAAEACLYAAALLRERNRWHEKHAVPKTYANGRAPEDLHLFDQPYTCVDAENPEG